MLRAAPHSKHTDNRNRETDHGHQDRQHEQIHAHTDAALSREAKPGLQRKGDEVSCRSTTPTELLRDFFEDCTAQAFTTDRPHLDGLRAVLPLDF